MARFVDVHPDNPQPRAVAQLADSLRTGSVIAFPTDTGYALGCGIGQADALDRIRDIRRHDARHNFTLVCNDFSQMSEFVRMSNSDFRAIKASTPGPFTFVLPATKEVPRRLQHPKKQTVGVRMPGTPLVQALLADLGEPIVSTTLLLPDQLEPPTDAWQIKEELDHLVDVVVDAGPVAGDLTTLIDLSGTEPEILRVGAGDPARFQA